LIGALCGLALPGRRGAAAVVDLPAGAAPAIEAEKAA
jgi:hypothetical protein